MSTLYTLYRNIERPIVFKGLKAQYIWWLAIGLLLLLLLFALLYIVGVSLVCCTSIVGILGALLFQQVYRFSRAYGLHGWMKKEAKRVTPKRIYCDHLFSA